ncbi:hypothetical protein [Nocardioides soli]|uniref:Uncharacterized protein n=1 Tax=Nocardioides soli TaxID=1036020 RepID=A0A7W4VTT4_9ACTN|nr:hypothetical protein [Nocardioides soli]MBB3041232.1 hypothetical protein [Nocardioides soli]
MAAHTVRRRGTDSSGRGIYASDYMWSWWQQVLADPAVAPFAHLIVITQGAWMTVAGGGARASAGYHDGGGCFDLRVWNLTSRQVVTLVWAIRRHGGGAWLRNLAHGGFTDPHIHLVLGTDYDLDSGAAWQWSEYIAGRNGLASSGRDYHRRPNPLITTPPEDDMANADEVLAAVEKLTKRVDRMGKNTAARDRRIRDMLLSRIDQYGEKGATAAQLKRLRADVALALADEDNEA